MDTVTLRSLKFDIFDGTLRSCDVAMDIGSQLLGSRWTPHTGRMYQTVCRHRRTFIPPWLTRNSSRTFKMPKKSDAAKLAEGATFKIWYLLSYKIWYYLILHFWNVVLLGNCVGFFCHLVSIEIDGVESAEGKYKHTVYNSL